MKVNEEHVRQACHLAIESRNGGTPMVIRGENCTYKHHVWITRRECGTACCIWGAACLIAGELGNVFWPHFESLGTDERCILAMRLMTDTDSTPEQILAALDGETNDAN